MKYSEKNNSPKRMLGHLNFDWLFLKEYIVDLID